MNWPGYWVILGGKKGRRGEASVLFIFALDVRVVF